MKISFQDKLCVLLFLTAWAISFTASLVKLPIAFTLIFVLVIVVTVYLKPYLCIAFGCMFTYNHPMALHIPFPIQAVLILGTFLSLVRYGIPGKFHTKYLFAILIFFATMFASVLFSNYRITNLQYLLLNINILLYFFAFLCCNLNTVRCVKLFKFTVLIVALNTVLSFFHFYFADILYINDVLQTKEVNTFGISQVIDAFRWQPAHKEPNYYAITLLFPFGLALGFYERDKTLFSLTCLLLILIGILMVLSRSTIIVCFFMLVVFVARKKKVFSEYSAIFVFIIISALALNIDVVLFERILSISENIQEEGGSGRFSLYAEAVAVFLENPLFGIGFGSFSKISSMKLAVHNTYLEILVGIGVFGFLAFISAIYIPIFKLVNSKHTHFYLGLGIVGTLVNCLTVSLFDLNELFRVLTFLYFYFVCVEKDSRERL